MRALRWLGLPIFGAFSAWLALGPVAAAVFSPPPSNPEGAKLFRRYCAFCHGEHGKGDGPNAPFLGDSPPRDLTDPVYMGKLSDERLLKVIAEGGRSVDLSNFMPPFQNTLRREQFLDLAAYVKSLRGAKKKGKVRKPGPEEAGARLVVELGCSNCHAIGDLPSRPVAPPLDDAGEKFRADWLVRFLKVPRRIRALGYVPLSYSRMPSFRLTDGEAKALTAYLLSRKKRMGAHAVLPKESGGEEEGGFLLLLRFGCRACHKFDDNEAVAGPDLERVKRRLRGEWVARFILDPQSFDPRAAMPRLVLSPVDARVIARFLSKRSGEEKRPRSAQSLVERGRALYRDLACGACHGEAKGQARPPGPPDLTHLGDKVRPDWLRNFLKKPRPMRFWLKTRMPNFRLSEEEADALARYFVRFRRDPKAETLPLPDGSSRPARPASIRRGKALFALYECAKCHPSVGTPLRPGRETADLAPSLGGAGRRLKPAWVLRFLRDPQSIYLGTRMPNFFYDSGESIEEEADEKMVAIRDYLMSLKR